MKNYKEIEFEKIVAQYGQRILNLIYSLCRNKSDAEDLTQETFIKAYKYFNPEYPNPNISVFLSRIAINSWKDKLRYNKRHGIEKIDPLDLEKEPAETSPTPSQILEQDQRKQIIQKLVNSLPEKYKTPMVLYLRGCDYQEIANILNRNLSTAKSLIFRGKLILKDELKKHFNV